MLTHPAVESFAVEMGRLAAPFALQVRHPLLDHRLFELAVRLPATASYRAGFHKMALRQALHGRLPETVRGARVKKVPIALFHRGVRERGAEKIWPLLSGMRCADAGLVDEARLRRGFRTYLEGGADVSFWRAASLEDWLRRYF